MPSIRVGSILLVIIPGDHEPEHVHVLGTGWEIRVRLAEPGVPWSIEGRPKLRDIRGALQAVETHLTELRRIWRVVNHGQGKQ